jgi:hypothetical protein
LIGFSVTPGVSCDAQLSASLSLLLFTPSSLAVLLPAAAAAAGLNLAVASLSDRKPAIVTLLPQSWGRGTSAVLKRQVVGSLQATATTFF